MFEQVNINREVIGAGENLLVCGNVMALPQEIRDLAGKAQCVYLDPPYKSDLAKRILIALDEQPYITEDTCIIVETDQESDFSFLEETGFEVFREKNYRANRHVFIRRRS